MNNQTGNSTMPDFAGLRAFVNRSDREDPLFFVGRERQRKQIQDECRKALKEHRAGRSLKGSTILLTGAPGAGKTSIQTVQREEWLAQDEQATQEILRLAEEEHQGKARSGRRVDTVRKWARRGMKEASLLADIESNDIAEILGKQERSLFEDIPVPVRLPGEALYDTKQTVTEIIYALEPRLETMFRTTETGSRNIVDAARLFLRGGAAGKSVGPPDPTFTNLAWTIRSIRPNRPICLIIDEIQDTKLEAKEVLKSLHLNAYGLPVVTVCAGLGNSLEHLRRLGVGLSRLSDTGPNSLIHHIDRLDRKEAEAAVSMMIDRYRIRTNETETAKWRRRIASEADSWPQHLHNGLRALAIGALENGGSILGIDGRRVEEAARRYRNQAYDKRISTEVDSARIILGKLTKHMTPTGLMPSNIKSFIWEHRRSPEEPESDGFMIPDNKYPDEFFLHLLKQGVLHQYSTRRCSCPIPSFKTYLQGIGGGDIHRSAALGDARVIRYAVESGTSPQARDAVGEAPMHNAARNGAIAAMQALFEMKADIDIQAEGTLRTPLHEAALAVRRFSEIEQEDEEQKIARRALAEGRLLSAQWLIDRSARLDMRDRNGNTPLHLAARDGNLPAVRLLLKGGARADIKNDAGETALSTAANEETRQMLASGARSEATSRDTGTGN